MNWAQLLISLLPQLVSSLPPLLTAIAELAKAFNAMPTENQQAITTAVKTVIIHAKTA